MTKPTKKVAIFVPLAYPFGMIHQGFFLSFFRANEYLMARVDELPFTLQVQLFSPGTFPIDANRNECVARMLHGDFDTSIWLDADQELSEDCLYRLLRYGADYPVYAGIYYLKKPPHHPIVFRASESFRSFYPIWRIPEKELFYADMIGMGCVKIDREVFESLERPYFAYSPVPEELKDLNETMRFKYEHGVNDVSEDVAFWRQVRERTNYRIVIDPQVQVGHIAVQTVTPEYVMKHAIVNKRVTEQQMAAEGKDFAAFWDDQVQKPELVDTSKNGDVSWLL